MLKYIIVRIYFADVVEQADTRDLKSLGGDFVPVQIRSSAPDRNNTNQEDDSRFVLFFARDYLGMVLRFN